MSLRIEEGVWRHQGHSWLQGKRNTWICYEGKTAVKRKRIRLGLGEEPPSQEEQHCGGTLIASQHVAQGPAQRGLE